MRILSCAFISAALSSCGSLYSVSESTGSETNGIHYYLPKNMVKIVLPFTERTISPGRYRSVVDKCFDPEDVNKKPVVLEEKTTFSLGDATIEVIGVVDHDHRYFIDLSNPNNPFLDRSGEFNLNQSQILTSASSKSDDRTLDFVLEIAESTVAIGASAISAGAVTDDPLVEGAACEGPAQMVIKELNTIRSNRLSLGSDSLGNLSLETYKQIRADLDSREKVLLGYFFGEESKKKFNRIVFLELNSDFTTQTISLFDDANQTLSKAENLKQIGKNSYNANVASTTNAKWKVDLTPEKTEATNSSLEGKGGFVYRVPGRVVAKLTENDTPVVQTTLPYAQFGYVTALPRRFGFLKSEVKSLELDPITGGIKKLSVNGEGISQSQIESANESYISDQEDTRVQELQRQKLILELERDIEKLRADQ